MVEAPLILGTRGSALALWQAAFVKKELEAAGYAVRVRKITTKGDRILDKPLADIGDKGLFTQELDRALLDGQIDLAVHSLKDLPTMLPEGLILAAVTPRAEPWDAFVAHPSFEGGLDVLPDGAVIATSSLRRKAQLKAWRPDVRVLPVRGNVDTRLRTLDASSWQGMVLAEAGLRRLGLDSRIEQRFPLSIMIPAVGQGALGLVCAEDALHTRKLLERVLHHPPSGCAALAERAFLRRLEGGCQAPIGAFAYWDEDGTFLLDGFVASLDGRSMVRRQRAGSAAHPEELGGELADTVLGAGGRALLHDLRKAVRDA